MTALCRRWTLFLIAVGSLTRLTLPAAANDQSPPEIRVGIIGLDTSHVVHFTRLLNAENPPPKLAGCRVVAALLPRFRQIVKRSFDVHDTYIDARFRQIV